MTESDDLKLLDENENQNRVENDVVTTLRSQLESSRLREKNLEQQIKMFTTFQSALQSNNIDLDSIYNQVLYKDARIVELNNIIMEKERQIMDLQEMCREQSQVAQSKNMALQIVSKKLKEFDGKVVRDVSTETDFGMDNTTVRRSGRKQRNESPGRAIPQFKLAGASGSPPPIDPEDLSSYTTETANYQDDLDAIDGDLNREWTPSPSSSSPLKQLRKYRKRVTFDLNPQKTSTFGSRSDGKVKREATSPENRLPTDADFAQTIIDLTTENDQLRKIIAEIEKAPIQDQQFKIEQLEEEIEQVRKDGKNQVLRARAAAQARIKELEGRILELQLNHAKERDLLEATSDTMKSGREWAINENARLVEQIASLKSKLNDLHGELDASLETNATYRQKVDAEEKKYYDVTLELKETKRTIQQLNDEKQIAISEGERLKEAIFAQDEFISLLEGDLIVYEAHIGILRDSLGASKNEDRQIIKSKAFAAKLNALEMEKQQIVKKNNDERLRTKALNVKIKCLENERDELLSRLQYYEQKHGANLAFHSTSQPVVFEADTSNNQQQHVEPVSGRSSETPPTAEEQQNDHNQHLNELQYRLEWTQHHLEAIQAENFKLEQQIQQITHEHHVLESTVQTFYERICSITTHHHPSSPNVEGCLTEIESVTRKILGENADLKLEKETLSKDLDVARHAASEMEHVGKDVLSLKDQMEQEKLVLEENWRQVKSMLVKKEKELASAEDKHTEKASQLQELEQQIARLQEENRRLFQENDEQLKTVIGEKESSQQEILHLKQTIQQLEAINANSSTIEKSLENLNEENDQLKQTVSALKANVEHYKIEAELSKSCLEDLRSSNAPITNKSVAPTTFDVDSKAQITAQEALQQSTNAQSDTQFGSTPIPNNSFQSNSTTYPTQNKPINLQNYQEIYYPNYASPSSTQPYQHQQANEYFSVYETNETDNTTSQHESFATTTHAFHQFDARSIQVGTPSSAFMPYTRIDSRTRLDISVDQNLNNNDILLAEEVLRLQKQKTDLESELNQVEIERSLQLASNEQLRSQVQEMKLQIERLEDQTQLATNEQVIDVVEIQILRETVETLRREKTVLETRLEDLEQEINKETDETAHKVLHMVDSEFDLEHPTHVEKRSVDVQCDDLKKEKILVDSYTQQDKTIQLDANIQCDFVLSENIQAPKEKKESTSSLDTKQLYETIEEEHRLLLTCVTESSKLEEHLSSNVGQLLVLNNELETAVDVLKAEIWSLNAQLRKVQLNEREEILDKLTSAETSLSTIHKDNILLKSRLDESQQELVRIKAESENRLGELQQLHEHKVLIENAYSQLSEKFEALQQAYNELLARYHIPKCDSSTDPLVEGAIIDNIEQLQDDLKELTESSATMREDLEKSAEKIRRLQNIIQTNLSTTRETLLQLKEEQIYCLRATVTATINEIKGHLLNSFSQLQDSLVKRKVALDSKGIEPNSKHEQSERISNAIKLCEEICFDIEKGKIRTSESSQNYKENSLEALLLEIRDKWKEKEQQLQQNSYMLEEEKQMNQVLELRLKEAENKIKQFEMIETHLPNVQNSSHEQASTLVSSIEAGKEPLQVSAIDLALHLRILAAKLTVKQADNDALFRATAELAHTNVSLQNEIEELNERLRLAKSDDVKEEDEPSITANVNLGWSSESGQADSILKEILVSTSKLRLKVKKDSLNEEIEKTRVVAKISPPHIEIKKEPYDWKWGEDENDNDIKIVKTNKNNEVPYVKMEKEQAEIEEYADQYGEELNQDQEQEEWKWESEQDDEEKNDDEIQAPVVQVNEVEEPEEWKWSDRTNEDGHEVQIREPTCSDTQKDPNDQERDWMWDSEHENESQEKEQKKEITTRPVKVEQQQTNEDWNWNENQENDDENDSVNDKSEPRPENTTSAIASAQQQQTAEDWGWDEKDEHDENIIKNQAQVKTKVIDHSQVDEIGRTVHKQETQPSHKAQATDWAWEDENEQDEDTIKSQAHSKPGDKKSQTHQDWKWSESEEELDFSKNNQNKNETIVSKQVFSKNVKQQQEAKIQNLQEKPIQPPHIEEHIPKIVQNKPERSVTPAHETLAVRSRDKRTSPYRAATPEDIVLTASKFRKRNK